MSLCECGCRRVTNIAPHTDRSRGHIKGQHMRYIHGHSGGLIRAGHDVEDGPLDTPCWIWGGSRNKRGYGRAWGGPAHRVYYEHHVGPIPEGLEIDHLCRNRACVNPAHLEPVTHKENVLRGAMARMGERSEKSPLLRSRLAQRLSQADLAARLGVSQAIISHWERGHHAPPSALDQDALQWISATEAAA